MIKFNFKIESSYYFTEIYKNLKIMLVIPLVFLVSIPFKMKKKISNTKNQGNSNLINEQPSFLY